MRRSPSASRSPDPADIGSKQVPLAETLARHGGWLFRWRSYLPLPLYLAILTWVWLRAPADQSSWVHFGWELFCLAVGFAGLGVRLWVGGLVPPGTSGRNTREQAAAQLNTSGPYSLVRHPLYVGNFFMWVAVAMFSRSPLWVLLTAVYFWACYERIMLTEERFLLDRFGNAFLGWASVTPALLPVGSRWKPPELKYSWRAAIRREYSGMFGFVAAIGLLELSEETSLAGTLGMDPFWQILLVVAAMLYVVLRTLKRRTTVLAADRR